MMAQTKYMFPAASDHGTVLKPDQVAVAFDEEEGYRIMMPDNDAKLAPQAVALVAAAMRLADDEDFLREMIAWMESRR